MPRPKSKSKSGDDKYTPFRYIRAVEQVLGKIDLDPASCEEANKRVRATRFFSLEENKQVSTLSRGWLGKVFLNPPYSRGNLSLWTKHLINQHAMDNHVSEAILLVPNWTERKWFQPLWKYPVCFTDHRIDYVDGLSLKLCGNPEGGSCFFYFPTKFDSDIGIDLFIKVFSKLGHIVDQYRVF